MLKCVFIGRRNEFNLFFTDWLATRTLLQAIIWADRGRYTWQWRRRWLKRMISRRGVLGTIDRMLFRLWCIRAEEIRAGWRRMVQDMRAAGPAAGGADGVEQHFTHSVNTPEVQALVKRLQPDVLIANCVAQLIANDILRIPRLGTYVYHEGLTPEYRGQHTPFWAVANGDNDKVGYTLLRANDKLDGGEVYAQGPTKLDPLATSLGYLGHWALFEGLPDVERVLQKLEEGTAQPIDTSGRREGYYSYFPYSKLLRILRRRRQRGLTVGPATVTYRTNPQAGGASAQS